MYTWWVPSFSINKRADRLEATTRAHHQACLPARSSIAAPPRSRACGGTAALLRAGRWVCPLIPLNGLQTVGAHVVDREGCPGWVTATTFAVAWLHSPGTLACSLHIGCSLIMKEVQSSSELLLLTFLHSQAGAHMEVRLLVLGM